MNSPLPPFDADPSAGEPPMTPLQLVAGEADAALSAWDVGQRHPALAGEAAMRLLATWAHLRRFANPAEAGPELWSRLEAVVRRDRAALRAALVAAPPLEPAPFREAAAALDGYADEVGDDEGAEAAADQALELFCEIDNASLAAAALELLGEGAPELFSRVEEAEAVLADYADAFTPAARWASWMLSAYRADLDADPPLWRATLKYWRLEDRMRSLSPPAPQLPRVQEQATPERLRLLFLLGMLLRQGKILDAAEESGASDESLRWTSPDGRYFASVLLPMVVEGDDAVPLCVYDAETRSPVSGWAGRPVVFLGESRPLESSGCATFTAADLRRLIPDAGDDWSLRVGDAPTPWRLEEPEARQREAGPD